MQKFTSAMAQVNEWIAAAVEDKDRPLERGLRTARDVLAGYQKSAPENSPHNVQVIKQYNALVAMAMRNSIKSK